MMESNGASSQAMTHLQSETKRPESLLSGKSGAAFAVALSVVGIFAVLSVALSLWGVWTTVPLKSIGAFVPLVSLILILRVWRSLDWEMDGSWWGLLVLAVTIALVHLREIAIIELVVSQGLVVSFPPYPLVAVAYTAGAVLLFGGKRLLWRAKFPVLFMWLVSPVPDFFSTHLDLPLQHASSVVARAFAHALGQHLTPDQLLLMFTPQFGMFIAPGCNGIRGAVTLGMIALVAGYLYQFKPWITATVVAGSIMLGYVFNFLRLCGLVVYYVIALHIPWLQTRATMGDYMIGATLFAVATWALFTVIRKLGVTGDLWPPDLPRTPLADQPPPRHAYLPRWIAFAVLIAVGSVSYVRALADRTSQAELPSLGEFPQQVGPFHLTGRRNESMPQGPLLFYWGDYANDAGDTVSIAVSPNFGAHDSLVCRYARGEDWQWHGNLPIATATGEVGFSGSFYLNDTREVEEATTVCTGDTCGQYATENLRLGLIYSVPKTNVLLNPSPTRPIPVMIRAVTTDIHQDPAHARAQLTADIQQFLAHADLASFTLPYRK